MTLYSKDFLISAVASMKKSGRLSHGFLLTGEKGAGKKTAALYIAKALMCENCSDGVPCGKCRHCLRIDKGTHPDVIIPERSGKSMIYTVETVKDMYADAYVRPNDCEVKVYILADCENIQERTQNIMLKLIEEPPDYACFIFTAADRSVFLPTLLSRVISFGIPLCSEDECRKALSEAGNFSEARIEEAVEAFHGNIGNCLDYLNGGNTAEDVKLCRTVADGILSGDEYSLCKALCGIGTDRERVKRILGMTDRIIRDVCVIRLAGKENAELIGCYRSCAEKLAERLSFRKAEKIHEALHNAAASCRLNPNVPLAMSALSGELI